MYICAYTCVCIYIVIRSSNYFRFVDVDQFPHWSASNKQEHGEEMANNIVGLYFLLF